MTDQYKIETECHCASALLACQIHSKDDRVRAAAWKYKFEKSEEKARCPVPDCPADRKPWVEPVPGCRCGGPLWIVIPPGQHIHPCPVHPDRVVYGPRYTL